MERLIDPLIADMQCEYEAAVQQGRPWRAAWARTTGYIAFWKVVGLHMPLWSTRILRDWVASDNWALGRTLGFATIAMMAITVLLIAVPLGSVRMRRISADPLLLVFLLPGTIPLSLPLGLLIGVLCGLRGRPTTNRVRRGVVVVGLVSSMVMVGTIGWLVPEANQAFRVAVAGRQISRGVAEMPLVTIRQMALDLSTRGRPEAGASLMVSYHSRLALAGTAFGFALFAFSVSACGLGRLATLSLGIGAPVVNVAYLWELHEFRSAALSQEGLAIVVAWLPTVMLILVSLALLSFRREHLTVS
jgi:lipopolysaccharide export LptBFGC system permease protein LptF